jgi:hypothetical protein
VTDAAQAQAIITSLGRWLAAAPGRRFTVEHGPDGWRATLDSTASASGATIQQVMAQAATIASVEVEVGEELQTP